MASVLCVATVSSLGALLSLLLLFQETDVDIKIDASKRVSTWMILKLSVSQSCAK